MALYISIGRQYEVMSSISLGLSETSEYFSRISRGSQLSTFEPPYAAETMPMGMSSTSVKTRGEIPGRCRVFGRGVRSRNRPMRIGIFHRFINSDWSVQCRILPCRHTDVPCYFLKAVLYITAGETLKGHLHVGLTDVQPYLSYQYVFDCIRVLFTRNNQIYD